MNTYCKGANRPRRRRGISQSGVRLIEAIVRRGSRAVRRSFVAADRRAFGNGGHNAT